MCIASCRTIARVLTASDTELASGINQVVGDEKVSKESECEALVVLGDVLAAELQQTTDSIEALRAALQRTPVVSAQQKAANQRAELLLALSAAREAVLTKAKENLAACGRCAR